MRPRDKGGVVDPSLKVRLSHLYLSFNEDEI